jgi:hypothetical protein
VNNDWLDYNELTFTGEAAEGQLPCLFYVSGGYKERFYDLIFFVGLGWVSSSLAARLAECNI